MGHIIRFKGDKLEWCPKAHDYELSKKAVKIRTCMKCKHRGLIRCRFEDGVI